MQRVQHPNAGFRRITAPGVEPAPIDLSFQLLPRRWVVECTYRLASDFVANQKQASRTHPAPAGIIRFLKKY